MRQYSYALTKAQYNLLLPVYNVHGKRKVWERIINTSRSEYYFIGTNDDIKYMLTRIGD